jgi:hypothetical protein
LPFFLAGRSSSFLIPPVHGTSTSRAFPPIPQAKHQPFDDPLSIEAGRV